MNPVFDAITDAIDKFPEEVVKAMRGAPTYYRNVLERRDGKPDDGFCVFIVPLKGYDAMVKALHSIFGEPDTTEILEQEC